MLKQFTPFAFTERNPDADRPAFVPCTPSQAKSLGYIKHRNDQDVVAGVELVMVESKTVPADLVTRRAEVACDKIEQETGRRPKGKHLKEVKEQITQELLATAFPKRRTVPLLWLDGLVLVGSATGSDVDLITSFIVANDESLNLERIQTAREPGAAMGEWARDPESTPEFLQVGRASVVESLDGARASFKDTSVENPEVVQALRDESLVTSLALSTDRGVSFTLTDSFQFKGLRLDNVKDDSKDHADAVAATCTLWRAELAALMASMQETLNAA